jgi:hypothetical protein
MKNLSLTIILFVSLNSIADDTTTVRKIWFGGLQQLGIRFSENSTRPAFTLINGVHYRRLFIGLGADYSFGSNPYYHGMNSTNLFLDSRYFVGKNRRFFARMDGGVSLITSNRNDYYYPMGSSEPFKSRPGYFGAMGIGAKARLGREVYYTVDLCIVLKQMLYSNTYRDWGGREHTDRYDLRQSMIQLNMGLEMF